MADVGCRLPEDLMAIAEGLLEKQLIVRGLLSSATPTTMDAHSIGPLA